MTDEGRHRTSLLLYFVHVRPEKGSRLEIPLILSRFLSRRIKRTLPNFPYKRKWNLFVINQILNNNRGTEISGLSLTPARQAGRQGMAVSTVFVTRSPSRPSPTTRSQSLKSEWSPESLESLESPATSKARQAQVRSNSRGRLEKLLSRRNWFNTT